MTQLPNGFEEINAEARRIWDANAEWWDDRKGDGSRFEDELLIPVTERLLELQPGQIVLDVGCGAGRFARRLAESGAHVVACDFSERFIQRARKRTPPGLTNVEYHVLDATSESALLALGPGGFDAAVATMVLMDMAAIDPFMAALSKLLKPGGRFVFTVMHPCFNSPHAFKVAEEALEQGRVVFRAGMKVMGYLTATVTKGEGILGQPEPQLYFHRPIGQLLEAGFRHGFMVDAFEELEEPPAQGTRDPRLFRFSWDDVPEIPPVLAVRMRLHNR
jgi:2-polyprenyl-3-methyl-5-hydroxy-6-metoxy-1,4-benzoquinol methylase